MSHHSDWRQDFDHSLAGGYFKNATIYRSLKNRAREQADYDARSRERYDRVLEEEIEEFIHQRATEKRNAGVKPADVAEVDKEFKHDAWWRAEVVALMTFLLTFASVLFSPIGSEYLTAAIGAGVALAFVVFTVIQLILWDRYVDRQILYWFDDEDLLAEGEVEARRESILHRDRELIGNVEQITRAGKRLQQVLGHMPENNPFTLTSADQQKIVYRQYANFDDEPTTITPQTIDYSDLESTESMSSSAELRQRISAMVTYLTALEFAVATAEERARQQKK